MRLIELFARDADEASLWVKTEEGHKHFMPAQVRVRLGQARHDPVHGHFSESGSHPRFAAVRLSGAMKVAVDDPTDLVAVIGIGPFTIDPAAALFGWLFACQALGALAFKSRHIEVVATITAGEWLAAYAALLQHLRVAALHLGDELGEPDASRAFDDVLDQVRAFMSSSS